MKTIEDVKSRLEELKPMLRERFKVENIGFFGSYVRGEQKKKSDLDVLVEFYEPISLFQFIELEDLLSEKLGVKVDLVSKKALRPGIGQCILKEVIYV